MTEIQKQNGQNSKVSHKIAYEWNQDIDKCPTNEFVLVTVQRQSFLPPYVDECIFDSQTKKFVSYYKGVVNRRYSLKEVKSWMYNIQPDTR